MKKIYLALLIGLFFVCTARADDTVQNLRLKLIVAKDNGDKSSGKGLNDVNSLLQSNLSYDSYTTLAQKTVPLKEADDISLAEGVSVSISDVEKTSLSIHIKRNKKQVLSAKVTLRKGKPVFLGGFSGKSGKLMVVATLN